MESEQTSSTTLLDPSTLKLSPSQSKTLDLLTPEICVICLDRISDKATALPCRHDHFHFVCLGTWLQHQQRCPLCKEEVRAVRYKTEDGGSDLFHLPQDDSHLPRCPLSSIQYLRYPQQSRPRQIPDSRQSHHPAPLKSGHDHDPALDFRRYIYAHNLYSLHIGSNRHSRYLPSGSITPELFARSPQHISRARAFIRRELKVFDFLDPTSPRFAAGSVGGGDTATRLPAKRVTNREYLLEYVIAILQAVPLKGSEGQAEDLLTEYLGRRNARLFLHELEAWLRSPFGRLVQWDAIVQYPRLDVEEHHG